MRHRRWGAVGAVAAGTLLLLTAAAQEPKVAAKASAAAYRTPRTPWGDPDLQGWFTNRSENGTPLERPAQFEGRKLEEIQGAELAAIKQKQQDQTVDRFKGPLSAPEHWWQDDLNMVKGSQAWLIIDPLDGKVPPLTQPGKDRAAARAAARRGHGPADSWLDRSLYDRCITRGMPGSMMPVIYGNSYQILQAPGYVTIRIEMVHETRVIPLDGSPHVAPAIRSYMGDPRGHWEGDTLVVETTNFRDDSTYRGANGATLKVTERFRRVAPDRVRWAVTLDDPETWTSPWTFAMPLTRDDTQPVLEYSCHEGNYGLRNILSAARAEEKKAAEEAAPKR
ncbi:MAG: hypothetical protein LAP40_14420 [Acidobacteriia bacterium]|nr:hypothetical protein [Terriglobia bacterium]